MRAALARTENRQGPCSFRAEHGIEQQQASPQRSEHHADAPLQWHQLFAGNALLAQADQRCRSKINGKSDARRRLRCVYQDADLSSSSAAECISRTDETSCDVGYGAAPISS